MHDGRDPCLLRTDIPYRSLHFNWAGNGAHDLPLLPDEEKAPACAGSWPKPWSARISSDREGASPPGPARHLRLGILFERALGVPAGRRAAFVAEACADDASLGEDLISLLEAHDGAGDYFHHLSADVLAPVLSAVADPSGETAEHDTARALQATLASTYRIQRELGGGGMSRVFLAEDLRLKRRVVIKVLPREMAPAANAERFHREIQLAARLQHPHIVPLLETDSADGMLYYTMPFVTGESLSDRLAREGSLPLVEALRIWRDVLDALSHAHASGVVHRDIKPGNILVSGRHALVTDFGISRAIETAAGDARVPPGMVIGTPAYMAPEETAGGPEADHRADIYAAGLVMYEMLSGSPPFVAASADEYLLAHRTREPPPLLRPEAPQELLGLVMRCLSKEPARRPQSVDAILAELDLGGAEDGPSTSTGNGAHRVRRVAPYAIVVLALLALPWTVKRLRHETFGVTDAAHHTPDIAAHEWYLRGMDVALLRTDSGVLQGVDYFQRAISIDPTYVDAYAGLVRMYIQLSFAAQGAAQREWLDRARQAALTATALDEADPDGRAALGWVHLLSRDYAAAEAEFKRAIALNPSVPRGHEGLARVYMMRGRPADQLAEARLGMESDPFSHSAIRELALALATNGRCEESLDQLRPLRELSPPAGVAGILMGLCYASRQMWPEAITEFRWAAENSATAGLAFLGYALARAGRKDEAASILSELLAGRQFSHGSFGIAIVYAGMRDYDRAFAWLDKAVDDNTISFYIMHPVFADLQQDPRFDRIKERMGAGGNSPSRRR